MDKKLNEDKLCDICEEKLEMLIRQGFPEAIFFYLKTKGRKRGYIESRENVSEVSEKNGINGI